MLDTTFMAAAVLHLALNHVFAFIFLPLFMFSKVVSQCDRLLVLLVMALMAGWHGVTSCGGITLCRGWLCQSASTQHRRTEQLCSRSNWGHLMPCFCSWATRKSQFLRINQKLGTLVYPFFYLIIF